MEDLCFSPCCPERRGSSTGASPWQQLLLGLLLGSWGSLILPGAEPCLAGGRSHALPQHQHPAAGGPDGTWQCQVRVTRGASHRSARGARQPPVSGEFPVGARGLQRGRGCCTQSCARSPPVLQDRVAPRGLLLRVGGTRSLAWVAVEVSACFLFLSGVQTTPGFFPAGPGPLCEEMPVGALCFFSATPRCPREGCLLLLRAECLPRPLL